MVCWHPDELGGSASLLRLAVGGPALVRRLPVVSIGLHTTCLFQDG